MPESSRMFIPGCSAAPGVARAPPNLGGTDRCVEYEPAFPSCTPGNVSLCPFCPNLLLPVLFYHPLKDLGDNPRAHRTLEQSQVGMSFPTPARSPLKGTTDSDVSYFTKWICGSALGVKPQGSAGAGGEESPPCQGDGQGQLFGKNATNTETFLEQM